MSKDQEDKTLRAESEADIEDVMKLISYAFWPTKDEVQKEFRDEIREASSFLVRDGATGKAICCNCVHFMTENVRGRLYKMGGVSIVSSYPETRRKGNVKKLMIKTFEYMRNEKMTVSTLYPFKESFYEHLGYVPFPVWKQVIFNPKPLVSLLSQSYKGEIERLPLAGNVDIFHDVASQLLKSVHGLATFNKPIRKKRMEWYEKQWLAVARVNDKVAGVMIYKIEDFLGKMSVKYFYYLNSTAKYLLLQWIAKHSDQVTEISMNLRADESIDTWALDLIPKFDRPGTPARATGMGRVISVTGLDGLPVPHVREHFVFTANVKDYLCDWNNKTFTFETVDGELKVREASSEEQKNQGTFNLTIQGLSGLVYGCIEPSDIPLRNYGNPTDDDIHILEKVFTPLKPYLGENF